MRPEYTLIMVLSVIIVIVLAIIFVAIPESKAASLRHEVEADNRLSQLTNQCHALAMERSHKNYKLINVHPARTEEPHCNILLESGYQLRIFLER